MSPAKHIIDIENKIIQTSWSGEPIDSEMLDALTQYQKEIKNKPEYFSFNEIVDLTGVGGIHLTTEGIKKIGNFASRSDRAGINTKLAFITSSPLAFGLTRMYAVYRNFFAPNTNKAIKVFKKASDAYEWIGMNT